jgi:hypothetical protein
LHTESIRNADSALGAAQVPLSDLRPGQVATVCETCLDAADAAVLRAMGLRPNATVRLCRLGDPCIVEVVPGVPGEGTGCERPDCRCRIGLTAELARRVKVMNVR